MLVTFKAEGLVTENFAFERGQSDLDLILATPDPSHILVVASGQSYFLRIMSPDQSFHASLVPVKQVLTSPEHGLIVLVGLTAMQAYNNRCEMVYETAELSWDGLEVSSITNDTIIATAWDDPNQCSIAVTVIFFLASTQAVHHRQMHNHT